MRRCGSAYMIGGMDEALHSKDVARSAISGGPKYPEFPGCHPVRISRAEIRSWEGRIEFWDADTEIAMVCEPTAWYHEVPGQRLAMLARMIAAVRGAQIEAAGSSDLLLRNARREWWRIMQPDQMLFLNQQESEPAALAVEVGLDRLPDVVLEVDNTTDVRRGKLGLYEAWGFGEVWVEVPEHPAPGRPASLRPGPHDSSRLRRRLPAGAGQPRLSGLVRGGDPHGAERARAVRGNSGRVAPRGPGHGRGRGHRPRGRPVPARGKGRRDEPKAEPAGGLKCCRRSWRKCLNRAA